MSSDELDIKAIRATHKLTQQELADRLGVNLSTVWRWENGCRVTGPARAYIEQMCASKPSPQKESAA